ncbi:MAG: hypothetical protein Q8T08_23240, partial [Ignavibacteria bacterium]|nr:hypothetical protein [Ignavibacteria bacterium]
KKPDDEEVHVADFIAVKSYKAKGKRISTNTVESVTILEPITPSSEPEEENEMLDDTEVVSDNGSTEPDGNDETQSETTQEPTVQEEKFKGDGPVQMELPF